RRLRRSLRGLRRPTRAEGLRASVGAIFRVPLVAWDEAPEPWVALVARGGSPLHEVVATLGPRATFVLGSEREGLPDDLVAQSHEVTIALPGAAESLNVAAAGAIALYEASRGDGARSSDAGQEPLRG
ncbi:MAG: TrmH family RNA methyltransferase, partial [Gaiella sp.]